MATRTRSSRRAAARSAGTAVVMKDVAAKLGPMSLHAPVGDLDFRTVTAHYEDISGTPLAGTVTFAATTPLSDETADLILMPTAFTATLDSSGEFSIDLPCGDDPDISPSGWTYKVTEKFSNNSFGRTYTILVPYDNGDATPVSLRELADFATAASSGADVFDIDGGTP